MLRHAPTGNDRIIGGTRPPGRFRAPRLAVDSRPARAPHAKANESRSREGGTRRLVPRCLHRETVEGGPPPWPRR